MTDLTETAAVSEGTVPDESTGSDDARIPPEPTGLEVLDGFPFPVFVSPGGALQGRIVAERAERTLGWLKRAVTLPKTPPLFVVGPEHWDQVAEIPLYGMPHVDLDRIVVGLQPAAFWPAVVNAIMPVIDAAGLKRLRRVYGDGIDLAPFADLLVSHELSHLTHLEADWESEPSVAFWLSELAANLGLHGYVHEVEPEHAATLETAFEVTWAAPNGHWRVRDLLAMEDSLNGDGSNYVWFEFGLQVLAKRLWQTTGVMALQRVVAALRGPSLGFDQVVELLTELDPSVSAAVLFWPDFPATDSR
ncbi:hypothetical protein [Streptomyces sp. NPDC002159]